MAVPGGIPSEPVLAAVRRFMRVSIVAFSRCPGNVRNEALAEVTRIEALLADRDRADRLSDSKATE